MKPNVQKYQTIKQYNPALLSWIEKCLKQGIPVDRIKQITGAHVTVIERIRSEGNWLLP